MDGLKFNNKHSFTDFGLVLKSYRNIKPSMRKREIEIPGKDGSYTFPSSSYSKRIISCKFSLIDCTTLQELRQKAREISDWLSAENANLEFDDEPGKIYTATVYNSIDPEEIATMQEFTVEFECQPFAFGETITYTENVNGYTEFFITNIGTKPIHLGSQQGAFFIVKITGSFDDITISVNETTINYTESVIDSEIIIDNCKGLVKKDGVNVIHNCSGDVGQFFSLTPGENIVEIDGTNLNCVVTIQFNPLWI